MLSRQAVQYSYNQDLSKQQEENADSTLGNIFKYTAATLADTVITTVDSLSFGLFDNDDIDGNGTSQALHWLNEDLGTYYDNNKEAVDLGSFVGGIFLPGFAAAKAMKWAKEGTTTFKAFFNPSAKWEATASETLAREGARSRKYKDAISNVKWHTIKESAAEGAMYEIAYAQFNAQHAYLEDYSITDFAIGAGLGAALGAPLRWIGKKQDIIKDARGIQAATDTGTQINTSVPPSIIGGNRLSAISYNIQQLQQDVASRKAIVSTSPASATDFAEKQYRDARVTMISEVEKVASDELVVMGEKVRKKARGDQPRTAVDNIWDADPVTAIADMSIKNPEAWKGVDRFGIFDNRYYSSTVLDNITKATDQGFHAARAGDAVHTLFIPRPVDKTPRNRTQLAALQDKLGISVDIGDNINIYLSKTPGVEHRQWLGDFLSLKSNKDLSLNVTGKVGKLKINTSAQKRIADQSTAFIDSPNKFVPYQVWRNETKYLNDFDVVLDPWMPGNPISTMEAAASRSAFADTDVAKMFRPKATMATKMHYSTDKQSVPMTDLHWLEGLVIGKREKANPKSVYKLGTEEAGIFKLQGLLHALPDIGNFPAIIKIGNQSLEGRNAAVDFLWNWKQTEAKKLADLGASELQIAKKLNLPPKTVEAMHFAQYNLERGANEFIYYTKEAEQYMNPRTIVATGKGARGARQDEMNALSFMDAQPARQYHESVIDRAVKLARLEGTELLDLQREVLQGTKIDALRQSIATLMTDVADVGVSFFSRNHTLRSLGPIADDIVAMGSNLQTLSNKLVARHSKALEVPLSKLRRHAPSAQQFAQVYNLLSSFPSKDAKKFYINGAKIVIGKTDDGVEEYLKYAGTDQPIVMTAEHQAFWNAYLPIRQELQELNKVVAKLQGKDPSNGLPLWLPTPNMQDSFVAFRVNATDNTDFQMIVASTAKQLDEILARNRELDRGVGKYNYITRTEDQLGQYNKLYGYAEMSNMQPSNSLMARAGVQNQEVLGDVAVRNLIAGIRGDVVHKMRMITKLSIDDVLTPLDAATKRATESAEAGTGFIRHKLQRPVTLPEVVRKTILNESFTAQSPLMDWANNTTTAVMDMAINGTERLYKKALRKDGTVEFEALTKGMRDYGIIPSWNNIEDFELSLASREGRSRAQHLLAKNQALLVGMNLRFLEVAHAAVTVLSAPLIIMAETSHLAEKGPLAVTKILMDSGKWLAKGGDETKRVMERAKYLGYTKSVVAEASDVLADIPRYGDTELYKKYKGTLDKMMIASDWSEEATREWAFAAGYQLAKQKYPTAHPDALITHAGAFVTRTMGNYTSRQKPTLFQGTFGQMIGLYQTFMLTMGQNMYRYAEAGDRRAIGTLLGMQGAMFGVESLPFYDHWNRMVGEYVSDDNVDISSTVYKAFGNTDDQSRSTAEFILYGLPSVAFGSGLYTRAAWEPRGPVSIRNDGSIGFIPPILSAWGQAMKVGVTTATQAYKGLESGGGIKDMYNAALQGITAQSLWRPGARMAEQFLQGKTYDQKGEIVIKDTSLGQEDPWAIPARILGTRPLQEHVLRTMRYRASYYNRVDRERRQKTIQTVRRIVSNGENMDQLNTLMFDYINKGHGTYKGWGGIVKSAYAEMNESYANRLAEYATKQPAIVEIADSYGL